MKSLLDIEDMVFLLHDSGRLCGCTCAHSGRVTLGAPGRALARQPLSPSVSPPFTAPSPGYSGFLVSQSKGAAPGGEPQKYWFLAQ